MIKEVLSCLGWGSTEATEFLKWNKAYAFDLYILPELLFDS